MPRTGPLTGGDSIFTLTEAEQTKRAKTLQISLMAKVRKKSDDPRYIDLGERLEKLREKYESGVLSSINWLKELLVAARETVHLARRRGAPALHIQGRATNRGRVQPLLRAAAARRPFLAVFYLYGDFVWGFWSL